MSAVVVLALRLALALALYAFLGWALYALWQDFYQRGETLALFRIPVLTLATSQGQYSFQQVEVTLGRDPANDLTLDDPTVSARHARLSYHHNHWWAEDLHSTNGTMLNGERLQTATVLMDGDVLALGQVQVEVKIFG